MLGDLPVWKQLVAALVVVASMGAGAMYAGMCGGIVFGVAAGVFLQVIAVAMKRARQDEDRSEI